MSDEPTFSRGEGVSPEVARAAELEVVVDGIFNQRAALPEAEEGTALELAGPYWDWNIYARGPSQPLGKQPNRVIFTGEDAWIEWVVVLNNRRHRGRWSACENITNHEDKIEIFFFTSNMQTMQPVPSMSTRFCIPTKKGKCCYSGCWKIPTNDPACLYETNICARICNCQNHPLPEYSGFVRWVRDWDRDWLFKYEPWTFDHPIRFMVSDLSDCQCK